MTQCNSNSPRSTPRRARSARVPRPPDRSDSTYLDFPALGSRQVLASFDGGDISSDGGSLLLRKTEELTGIIRQFAACFTDHRNPELIEHTLEHLVAQRVYALALGYEDLNDHDVLRHDPLLATVVGKKDPTGQSRLRERDKGKALAGKSTLNRLELTPVGADEDSRYKKITCSHPRRRRPASSSCSSKPTPCRRSRSCWTSTPPTTRSTAISWAASSTATTRDYCFLPLYIFCGDHLLCARLRPSDIDATPGP